MPRTESAAPFTFRTTKQKLRWIRQAAKMAGEKVGPFIVRCALEERRRMLDARKAARAA